MALRFNEKKIRITVISSERSILGRIKKTGLSRAYFPANITYLHAYFPHFLRKEEHLPADILILDYPADENFLNSPSRQKPKNFPKALIILTPNQAQLKLGNLKKNQWHEIILRKDIERYLIPALRRAFIAWDQDIENKRIQKKLIALKRQDHLLLASINSILIGINSKGLITHWNSVSETTFGLLGSHVMRKKLSDLPILWDKRRVFQAVDECISTRKSARVDDVLFKRHDGNEGFLGFTINPFVDESHSGCLIFGADITARKEAEELIRVKSDQLKIANEQIENEKVRYETLLNSIGDAMIAVDEKGRVIMANPQVEVLLGWDENFLKGKNFMDIVRLEDEKGNSLVSQERPLQRALSKSTKAKLSAYYVRKDGSRFPAEIGASPIIINQKLLGAIEIFRDITVEKDVEKLKSEFVSNVTHELRSPLTCMRESVAQVLEGLLGPVNSSQKEYLDLAVREMDRLTNMVNDLLDFSKIESGKLELKEEWFDAGDLLKNLAQAHQSLFKTKKMDFELNLPKEDCYLLADKQALTQILTNLLSNAFKFTGEKGKIELGVNRLGKNLHFYVRDSGEGISEENQKKIFDRFVQVGKIREKKIKGTGLGLAICKNWVEMHHGSMGVESVPGKGSCFFFDIPLNQQNAEVVNVFPMQQKKSA